jgi:hypothetical protein
VIGLDLTIPLMVMRLFAGLLIATLHGAVIAAAAVWLGDRGPRDDGRFTLMPNRHLDLIGLVSTILSGFGWSRAVDVDPGRLRGGRWSIVAVVLAGSVALLALAWLLRLLTVPVLTGLDYSTAISIAAFLRLAARVAVWAAILAVLPLPALAGGMFLTAAGLRLPAWAGMASGVALLVLSALGVTRMVLAPVYGVIAPLLLGVDAAG